MPLSIWDGIYSHFINFKQIKFFFKIKDIFFIGNFSKNLITRHLAFVYETVTAFIICGKEARFTYEDVPIDKAVVKSIIEELDSQILKAESYVSHLSETFPDVIRAI